MKNRLFPILAVLSVLNGACAPLPPLTPEEAAPPGLPAPLARCTTLFQELDATINEAGVGDLQAFPVPGFPYLRQDRFLSSFRQEVPDGPRFSAWVARMRELDRSGRAVELANLAPPAGTGDGSSPPLPDQGELERCADLLSAHDLATPEGRERLRQAPPPPSPYREWQRVAGFYWISALAVKEGVHRWHREVRATHATPPDQLPRSGTLVTYRPPTPNPAPPREIREILERAYQRNALGIPDPTPGERERLFQAFAPTWQVDTASDDDRLGAPVRGGDEPTPRVDTALPVVYRLLAHTRWGGESLLQLVYVTWFPGRPAAGDLDLLAGRLDGIMWRVTLNREGVPLLYDTAHNCGCYHLFFPTRQLRAREGEEGLEEPAFVPAPAPELPPGTAPTLRIAATTHFVDAVQAAPLPAAPPVTLAWADYDHLRRLPLPKGGSRSLFRPDGIVPGTQRGERFILWPMGVPNPGEMRQWGHHATAFFGHRHFDDPNLLERYFEPRP